MVHLLENYFQWQINPHLVLQWVFQTAGWCVWDWVKITHSVCVHGNEGPCQPVQCNNSVAHWCVFGQQWSSVAQSKKIYIRLWYTQVVVGLGQHLESVDNKKSLFNSNGWCRESKNHLIYLDLFKGHQRVAIELHQSIATVQQCRMNAKLLECQLSPGWNA